MKIFFYLFLTVFLNSINLYAASPEVSNPYAPGATITIAALNSSGTAGANFFCTGTNDHLKWQEMMDYIATLPHAALVRVLGGLYHFAGTVFIPSLTYGGITIEGMGAACTTIYMEDGSNCDTFATSITAGSTFITMRNIMINGNRANNPSGGRGFFEHGTVSGDRVFEEMFWYNMHGNCVQLKCWGTRFKDCIFEDSDADGVFAESGIDFEIKGCKFIHMLGIPIRSNALITRALDNRIFMAGESNIGISLLSGSDYSFVRFNSIHHYTEITDCTGIQIASSYSSIGTNIIECNGNTLISNGIVLTATSNNCMGTENIIDMSGTKVINLGVSNTITANGVNY